MNPLQIAFIEPYDGGSHRRFRLDWEANSKHTFKFFTLPPRKWKWRMRGAAMLLQDQLPEILACDVLICSGFLNLAEFWGMASQEHLFDSQSASDGNPSCTLKKHIPSILFLHENQLTYPCRKESERDYHFGLTNVISAWAADEVWFNSEFHRNEFLSAVPDFLKKMPDAKPKGVAERIEKKSKVMHLGVQNPMKASSDPLNTSGRLRIGWNHRWEFDKGPEIFFRVLENLLKRNVDFEVVILGEQFKNEPEVFRIARERLQGRIVHWGFLEDFKDYGRLLSSCDVVISTAFHEFFGISVVEAALCGCGLLVPRKLSYPELFKDDVKDAQNSAFYTSEEDLLRRLEGWAADPASARLVGVRLQEEARRFLWDLRGPEFDKACTQVFSRFS